MDPKSRWILSTRRLLGTPLDQVLSPPLLRRAAPPHHGSNCHHFHVSLMIFLRRTINKIIDS
jgi:hypothetical protein